MLGNTEINKAFGLSTKGKIKKAKKSKKSKKSKKVINPKGIVKVVKEIKRAIKKAGRDSNQLPIVIPETGGADSYSKKVLKQKEKMLQSDIIKLKNDVRSLEANNDENTKEKERLMNKINEAELTRIALEFQINDIKANSLDITEKKEIDIKLEEERKKVANLEVSVAKLKGEIDINKMTIKSKEDVNRRLKEKIADLEDKEANYIEDISNKAKEYDEKIKQLGERNTENKNKLIENNKNTIKKIKEDYTTQLESLNNKLKKIEEDNKKLTKVSINKIVALRKNIDDVETSNSLSFVDYYGVVKKFEDLVKVIYKKNPDEYNRIMTNIKKENEDMMKAVKNIINEVDTLDKDNIKTKLYVPKVSENNYKELAPFITKLKNKKINNVKDIENILTMKRFPTNKNLFISSDDLIKEVYGDENEKGEYKLNPTDMRDIATMVLLVSGKYDDAIKISQSNATTDKDQYYGPISKYIRNMYSKTKRIKDESSDFLKSETNVKIDNIEDNLLNSNVMKNLQKIYEYEDLLHKSNQKYQKNQSKDYLKGRVINAILKGKKIYVSDDHKIDNFIKMARINNYNEQDFIEKLSDLKKEISKNTESGITNAINILDKSNLMNELSRINKKTRNDYYVLKAIQNSNNPEKLKDMRKTLNEIASFMDKNYKTNAADDDDEDEQIEEK